jgi:hypothetical protein
MTWFKSKHPSEAGDAHSIGALVIGNSSYRVISDPGTEGPRGRSENLQVGRGEEAKP